MCLKDLAKVICKKGTEDENLRVMISILNDDARGFVWSGRAKDLKTASAENVDSLLRWSVYEVKRLVLSDTDFPYKNPLHIIIFS